MKGKTLNTPNPDLQLAFDFIQHTCNNIFLTGKAGTGKTTFLHKLKKNTPKRMIITAPTGVAAINAGGVTLHSFFQIPFGPYVPGSEVQRQTEQRRFSKEKISIIKSLDLLVIDEISMVRADLLDAVDAVLRRYKHLHLPFGGVQLLMIGDLHQLSPVVKDDEWNLLKSYYDSQYFFSSNALKQADMISIELKHIYRQSDVRFIQLLNRVRDNRLDRETLQLLNTRYMPTFQSKEEDDYITLTTHNRSADNINNRHLKDLDSKQFIFQASIEGDYPEYNYPTAEKLILKKGAQVMFVRNDSSTEKLYFNGKIGKITHIDKQGITVECPDDGAKIPVERVIWENIKYTVDAKTKEITEEVIGKFSQYPLRPAWAITIHKSQGLTFERAIIDANAAFSHGQVYVALSRCKTFEGMVLSTPITKGAVKTDASVVEFVERANRNPPTQEQLNSAKILYQQKILLDGFDYHPLALNLRKFTKQLRDNLHLIRCSESETIGEMEKQVIEEIVSVADKFKRQLQSLFEPDKAPEDSPHIQGRVQKASGYFSDKLQAGLVKWASSFNFDTDNKEIRKQIAKAFEVLQHSLAIKTACLQSCRAGFSTGDYLNAIAQAEIDFWSPTPTKKQVIEVNTSDLEHSELFHELKAWRAKQAKEEGVEHFQIMHQRVLIQIARILPDTRDALLRIKGVGKHTAEKYGEQITAIVGKYCREQNIEPQQAPSESIFEKEPKQDTKKDTKQISYELHLQGRSIKEIAEERGLVTSTIEGHLAHYVGLGLLNIAEIVTENKIAIIKEAFDKKGKESLKVIKEYLGEEFSYGEIRLVLESLH